MTRRRAGSVVLLLAAAAAGLARAVATDDGQGAEPWAGQTFLADYGKLKPAPSGGGQDFVYVVSEDVQRFAPYDAVMVDQPEVAMSPDSPYRSAKPHDLAVIAEFLRGAVSERLASRGFRVVDQKGEKVLYLRMALTDLELHKKKRGVLTYTPIGAVTHAVGRALKDITGETEIQRMTVQAELLDSVTNEVLGATVLRRDVASPAAAPAPGAAATPEAAGQKKHKPERIGFEQFETAAQEYSDRLACRIDNARRAPEARVDCADPAARGAAPKPARATD